MGFEFFRNISFNKEKNGASKIKYRKLNYGIQELHFGTLFWNFSFWY